MNKISLYFECNSGISGDMAVAALIDAGADTAVLQDALRSIPITGFKTEITRVKKSGIDCCDFNVILDAEHENHDHDMNYLFGHEQAEHTQEHDEEHHHQEHEHERHEHTRCHDNDDSHKEHHHHEHRGLTEINKIIDGTKMTDGARALAKKILKILAESESKAHGVPLEEVHFHEVGAVDSIVDVIALAVCFDNLSVCRVYVPFLCEGSGTIRSQHGILSVPVPAVANIVCEYKIPLRLTEKRGEFVTPTGAAFVAAVRTDSDIPKAFITKKIGMGAGKRAYETPSILRAFLIEENKTDAQGKDSKKDKVLKLETNIDDSTGEQLGFVMEKLFEAGAFDVFYMPCFMKKSRPAWLLSVICDDSLKETMESLIFRHTTTIGIRRMEYERSILERKPVHVQTEFGIVNAKQVTFPDGEMRIYPEYESVAEISRTKNIPYETAFRVIAAECKTENLR